MLQPGAEFTLTDLESLAEHPLKSVTVYVRLYVPPAGDVNTGFSIVVLDRYGAPVPVHKCVAYGSVPPKGFPYS